MVVAPFIWLAKMYYPSLSEEFANEKYKEEFQNLLLGDDHKASVDTLSISENVISMRVNIHNVRLTESMKSKFSKNSHKIFRQKICSSIGLREWLEAGNWVSIDVIANSSKAVTNVRVVHQDCT
ncbi:TPA: hypothetical protein GRR50_22970 [Vibrio parahaemolyticus]|nr:hypothetical protein [Vibrio parahaemolyticus]